MNDFKKRKLVKNTAGQRCQVTRPTIVPRRPEGNRLPYSLWASAK